MRTHEGPPSGRASGLAVIGNRGWPVSNAQRPGRQYPLLVPSELAAVGLMGWPWPVVGDGRLLVTCCPRCGAGVVGLLPPRPFLVVNLRGCRAGDGLGLGCPPAAIAEAVAAVLDRRPRPFVEDDARRLGRFLVRLLPGLWSGRTGRDPRRALWAARLTLEETGLLPGLVELALFALARRRGWPTALVEAVLGREVAA